MNCRYCNANLDFTLSHVCKEEIEYWKSRAENLSKVIDEITNIGVYPVAVVGGDKPYAKRTEYMEGWNACATEVVSTYSKTTKELGV